MIVRFDPCGLICVLMIYGCVVYADYVITVWMVMPVFGDSIWGAVHIALFNTLIFMTLFSHARTMLTDPGVVPILKNGMYLDRNARFGLVSSSSDDDSPSDREAMMLRSRSAAAADWTMCTRCESFRPPRAHHCRVCRRCIRKMDHHCPWVNNCVGEFNQKFFLQFLFYVGLSSTYSIMVMVLSWVYDDEFASTGLKGPFGENAHHAKVLHSIFLSMESALFGMFVFAVSCDQLSAIFSDETAVEAVQRRTRLAYKKSRRRGRVALLREVCGGGSLLAWFFPCSSPPPDHDITIMKSEKSSKNVFQKLWKSWRSSQESSSQSMELVEYKGPLNANNPAEILFVDYYRILGVERQASLTTIKAAYHEQARIWHPDKNDGSERSKQRFIQVQRAYTVLSDPNKRAIYDRFGAMGLDVAEHYDEDQQQYMADFARSPKWLILVMCVGVLTCCFCCCCCFGCCSMCRRYPKTEESRRRDNSKRKRRAAELDSEYSIRSQPAFMHNLFPEDMKVKGLEQTRGH